MTVEELIAELHKLPLKAQVILQKDAEGNGYSPLYEVDGDAIAEVDVILHHQDDLPDVQPIAVSGDVQAIQEDG